MTVSPRIRLMLASVLGGLCIMACTPPNEAGQSDREPVSEAESSNALSAFGLDQPGRASWSDRQYVDGAHIFSDFVLTDADGVIQAEQLRLVGAHLDAGAPRFDALTINQATVNWDDGQARFATLSLYDPSETLAERVARSFRGDQQLDMEAPGDGFARFTLTQLQSNQHGKSGQSLALEIDQIDMVDYTDAEYLAELNLTGLRLSGLDEDDTPLSFNLGHAHITGARLEDMPDFESPLGTLALSPETAPFETLDVRDFTLQVTGMSLSMPELTGATQTGNDGVIASQLTLPALVIQPDPTHPDHDVFASGLQALGYESLIIGFNADTLYDPTTDRSWTRGENSLTIEDGVQIRFAQDVTGLAASAQRQLEARQSGELLDSGAMYEPVFFNNLTLEIEDRSLMGRMVEFYADQLNLPPDMVRAQAGSFAMLGLAFAGVDLPEGVMAQASTALNSFITEGGQLTIALDPPQPVPATSLMGREPLDAETMGLIITHQNPVAPE